MSRSDVTVSENSAQDRREGVKKEGKKKRKNEGKKERKAWNCKRS